MDNIVVRTDLAVEANEEAMNGTGKLRGIRLRESNKSRMGVKVTELQVTNHLGEAAIGRPKGTYLTIEADDITGGDEEYAKEVVSTLAGYIFKLLKRMNKNVKPEKILVIGLGNRNITSDSLGPEVVDNIYINIREGGDTGVCTLSPGVMAQTGMETFSIVKGIVDEMKPDLIIAIDSLAARNISRVTTTIQLTDTGIIPGSGIGNNREGLNRENLGCTVIAIGVPMVVHSVTIVNDTMDKLIYLLSQNMENNCLQKVFEDFTVEEKYQLFAEIMTEDIGQMFVTPKDVDEIVDNLSSIIANSINRL